MKTIILFSILITTPLFSQNKEIPTIQYDNQGFSPVVFDVGELSEEKIYDNIYVWISKYYKNPDFVIKSNIPNKLIKINGYKENSHGYNQMGFRVYNNMRYYITFDIKKGKYRFSFEIDKITNENNGEGYYPEDLFKRGQIRKNKIYRQMYSELLLSINDISNSLYNSFENKNDDW
ncbi:MAG: hypothetical protein P8I58_04835 [Flavobacteriaceae bacterium]|nr:hypothetical protein [Flavobacteriaceae bacterium]